MSVPDVHIAGLTNVLSNVPAFDWSYGCSATSASMLFGYYDRTGYSNMYTGPANGGIAPLDNSIWGHTVYPSVVCGEDPLSATHNGIDGRTTRGSVDDYWIDYGNAGPDPYITNGWTEHTPDAAGDFMGTNQSKFSNPDGSTSFYCYPNGDPLVDYTGCEPSDRDGCHGMKLFAQSRGYTVVTNFTQLIQGYPGTDPGKGFTFANFQAEIDAGRPVLIQLEGHTMLGYGYNTTGNIIYVHDTWDYGNHTMAWGGTYPYGSTSLQQYGVTVLRLQATAPTITNSAGASNILDISARLNGNLTNTGGIATAVHVCWGTTDGGTTVNNWANDINLGTLSTGTFFSDISGLSASTQYYYRCYAINSSGTGWASTTATFTTTVPQYKLIGVDAGAASTTTYPGGYFFLYRFPASTTGNMTTFKFKASGAGNVKVAVYNDNNGVPGALLNAVNAGTPVVAGWNSIAIPSTPVVSGTYYWLSYISDAQIGYYHTGSGNLYYQAATYSSFSFPTTPAGLSNIPNNSGLLAGWGFLPVPVAPTITNSTGVSNLASTSPPDSTAN